MSDHATHRFRGLRTRRCGNGFDTDGVPIAGNQYLCCYHALTNLGYSSARPPTDYDGVLNTAIETWIEVWATGLITGGVPKASLYTHIAYDPYQPFTDNVGNIFNFFPGVDAFTAHTTPGFSIYGTDPYLDASGEYQGTVLGLLSANKSAVWGISEGTNVSQTSTQDTSSMLAYLTYAFKSSATYVNLFGFTTFDPSLWDEYEQATMAPASMAAYRWFISNGTLSLDANLTSASLAVGSPTLGHTFPEINKPSVINYIIQTQEIDDIGIAQVVGPVLDPVSGQYVMEFRVYDEDNNLFYKLRLLAAQLSNLMMTLPPIIYSPPPPKVIAIPLAKRTIIDLTALDLGASSPNPWPVHACDRRHSARG